MGNFFSSANFSISFQKLVYEPYFYEVFINSIDLNDIQTQLELVSDKNNVFTPSQITKIMCVLNYIFENENVDILKQVDGYLFEKFNGLPLLAIINTSAKAAQNKYNTQRNDGVGYYYVCDLTKTFGVIQF